MLSRLWSHRALLFSLVRRQYQLRYRQSAVGFAWALLPPLATLGVGFVLFKVVFHVETGNRSYEILTMAALVPWTFFANSVMMGVPSVVGAAQMVTRLSFPRGVIPLSMVGLSMLDLLVAFAAFVPLSFLFGDGFHLSALWVPLLLLIEIPLAAGVVLLGSALNVFARDIRLMVPLVVQFWLLVTPVMYPLSSADPAVRDAFLLNPMTGLVESFRDVLVRGVAPDVSQLLPAMIGAVVLFVVGAWYFRATEPRFADVI